MRYWDSSGLIPLLLDEPSSAELLDLLEDDDGVVLWWGSSVECHSALNRRFRDGQLAVEELQIARGSLQGLLARALEVTPTEQVRLLAHRLLAVHPLRAADSLQLSAALTWTDHRPVGREFVALDDRLRAAAQQEGFSIRPV